MDAGLQFGILGPLEVRADGGLVHVGGLRQRALLGLLLCHANQVVSRDELIDELLGDQPAGTAHRMLRVQVSRLRRVLADGDGPPRLLARPPGYLLRVEDGELDLGVFEQRVAAGRHALEHGNPRQAAALLVEAESLWRGRPLADLEFESFARFEIQRLEADRLAAAEDRIEAQLALGDHASVCAELERLVAEHPLRERLRGQLMVALYRSGRQAEALETYRTGRLLLVQELGIEPGPGLRRVHEQVLAAHPGLGLPAPAAAAALASQPALVVVPREVPAEVRGFTGGAVASAANRGVFVGRAGELAVLEAAAAAARRGEPQVVLVEGEAGAGKSSLLVRFASGLAGAAVLRATGDEAELLLPYGIVGQLTASARGVGGPPGMLAAELSDRVDPLAVGADLVVWLGECCRGQQMVLALIDDLQWADAPSARALLFAVRRLQADRVLEMLLTHGEVAEAEALAARMAAAGPDARRNWLLGTLDCHTGRLAEGEARLREAWQAHDRVREPTVGAEAAGWMAGLCLETGRIGEAIEWGERSARAGGAPAGVRHAALGVLAIALFADGRGPEGLSGLAFLPAAPAEVPREDTDTLAWWTPPGCTATSRPRPGTTARPLQRSRPPGAAPEACGCRWRWPSWRSPTPAGCSQPASRRRPSPGCARPGSA